MNKPIFLDYDRAALDAEYGIRADPTEFDSYIARWKTHSRKAQSELDNTLNLSYGLSDTETLDVFLSPNSGDSPINVFYHGGYWRSEHKDNFSYVAYALHEVGAVTVVVNYALVPKVRFNEVVRQCRLALAWVWKNANRFRGNRDKLFVSGHSAGGHLVAMLMATNWPEFDPELPVQPICGGCGISGLYDLEPIRLCFLNEVLQLNGTDVARNSPIKLRRTCLSSLLLPVGAKEGPEFLRQSNGLAAAWLKSGEPPEVRVFPDEDHFSIVTQLSNPESKLSRAIQYQMGLREPTG